MKSSEFTGGLWVSVHSVLVKAPAAVLGGSGADQAGNFLAGGRHPS
jgi:hypothetical protein